MNPLNYLPKSWTTSAENFSQESVSKKKDSVSNAVPLCLPNNYTWDSVTKKIYVDETKPRKTLTVCKDGLELLKSLEDQLLVVLCIAGPARSGKSFFASQLLEDVNFDVGHGAGSHTAGIWIGVGARSIKVGSDKARVVILDAEGLGGVNTDSSVTDAKWEHKIFPLCVLLSSYVIYNSKGPPNYDELDKLGFIAEFSRSISCERQEDVEKQQTPSVGFGQVGPDFLWLFRDVLFKPELKGKQCDWTEFVDKTLLTLKPKEPERNNIRQSILSTFTTIRAADLPPPTLDSNAIKKLKAEENKDKINEAFFPGIEKVVKTILSSVQIKIIGEFKLTGQLLIDMLSHVVDTVNNKCDELDVTSMWNGIVNTQMQRYIQSALDLYKKKMVQAELPEEEETYLKLHQSTKESSKVHFEEVTTRFDRDICSSQLQVLSDKIELEFHNSFLEKNEQASLSFNKQLNTELENEYFNNLPAKPSCMQLKNADEKFSDCYNKLAKGPKAVKREVKRQTQWQRDQKIGSMRTNSLIYAEQQSCEIFEQSLKEALEGKPLSSSELNTLKETCTKDCFNNLRKASCNGMDCTPCIKSWHLLRQKVESIFKTCSSECYDKSEKACQCLINELIKGILLPFVKYIESHSYSEFLIIKDDILTQYDLEAKGPAKKDLVGTCTKTIDMQKEGIQLLIIQSALNTVYCEYTQILNQTAQSDPCEDEELDRRQALKYREITSAFGVKCEGIDKSTLEPYKLNLEDLIKNFTTLIANENKSRSINLCEDLVTSLSREFHDGILQTHIPKIRLETEYSQCSHHLQMAEEFKNQILNDYKQRARGPEKERFQQSLNEYIEILLSDVKNVVNEMILKTVLQHHFYQLDTIKQKYPISETELQSAISETIKNTGKLFIDAQKQISLPFVSCSRDILSIILAFDTMQLVEENYKESMRQLDRICKDILLESRKQCEELVEGGEVDTVKFAKVRKEYTEKFDESGKGVLKDHYRSILQGNIDMEIRFAYTTLVDKIVKRIFGDCKTSIENLEPGIPYERVDLEKHMKRVKEDTRKNIEDLRNKVAEANITGTEEILKLALDYIISYVDGKNFNISSTNCNTQRRKVLEDLTNQCKTFLEDEKSTVEALCNIKTACLGEYDHGAFGAAKETVKESLKKEIDKEIQRIYVLFAKTNYLKILRVQTETFKFEDQVNIGQVNLDELTEHFEKESQDILLRYPGLEDEISNDLKNDLRKEREFYLKSLNQKITLTSEVANYRSSIEGLIKDGPCEEEHLKKQIDKKRKGAWERIEKIFTEVEQTHFASIKGMLKIALKDTTRYIETQNHILSTTKCNTLFLQVSDELKLYCKNFLASETSEIEDLRLLKDKYLRKYDEVATGLATEDERNKLEKEITEEVERTFVLFAKAKYRETLRVQTEAFKYEDQVNTSGGVNLDELTEHFEKESEDILLRYPGLEDKNSNDLRKDLRKEREFYLKVLNQQRTLTSEVANYRSSIEALIKDGPCQEEHLKKQIERKRKEAWESIENTFKEVEQTNFALTEGMLKEALEDTTRSIETQNHIMSTTKCNSHRIQISEELKRDCQNFLASETSVTETLRNFKDEFLRRYDEVAIGPAKADERNKFEKEIVEEVDRTFALFAKANFQKILRVKTEAFHFEDQVNTSVEVNLDELTEHLEKESKVILLGYPELEDKFSNDLSKELHKEQEFYLKALKQKITLTSEVANYRSSVLALIKDGPCEEEHLNRHIDKNRRGAWESIEHTFKEVEQPNFALTVGMLEKAMEDITRYIETQNNILSTTKCNSSLLQVLEELRGDCQNFLASETSEIVNLHNFKAIFLQRYDKVAIGPAKAEERDKLKKKIVEEVGRTFVLFAKAKYLKILRVQTEAFKFEDQVNTSGGVNLDELTEQLEKESKYIRQEYPELEDKFSNDLKNDLRKEREFYLKALNQKITLTSEVATYRSSIEGLIKDGPCEGKHLKTQIDRKRQQAWERIENTFEEVEQTNFALTVGMLKKSMEDITRCIETNNYILSANKCNRLLLQVLEELKCNCKKFLASDTSEIEELLHLKVTFLSKYDDVAIGPAKADERDKLENESEKEIQRTFVLFAKRNYLKILRVQTEAFTFEDQVNTSGGVNLDELTVNLEKESQDILNRYPGLEEEISNDLRQDSHKEREFYLKALNQKITLTSEVATYRSSIEALIKDGPCEEEHLKEQIGKKRKETWERIETIFTEVEETNFALTVGMLEKAMEDTTRNIETQNCILSATKCNSLLLQVSEELKRYCKNLSETSTIDNLRHLKDEYLRKYDQAAIGPAKAKERKTLEKEIVEEVDRTFVLFAKAKYRIILREEIQRFQCLDLLNNPDPDRIGQLVQLLKRKIDDILNTYRTLGRTTRNNLTTDLGEIIDGSLLKEIATVYEEKLNQLKDKIFEEDKLKDTIREAKVGLFDIHVSRILGDDYDLPKEWQTFIDELERNLKQDNLKRSRINCQKTLDVLFQYNWDHLTIEYFRKIYEEKCQGPAKQTVWEENIGRVEEYYNSYPAMFRKMKFWKWF